MKRIFSIVAVCLCCFIIMSCIPVFSAANTYKLGDANGDNKLNIRDVTYIQMYCAKMFTNDEDTFLLRTDVTGDNKISIRDATTIQMYLVGLISTFPVEATTTPTTTTESPTDEDGWNKTIFRP